MPRSIPLYTHNLDEGQRAQLDRALKHFQSAQQALRFREQATLDLPLAGARVDVPTFYAQPSSPPSSPCLVVTGRRLNDNWFTHTRGGRGLLTVADWQVAFQSDGSDEPASAPDAHILASLALTTTLILGDCDERDLAHRNTRGCLFDLCLHKPDRILKMRAAYICTECASALANRGVSSIEIDAVRALLERIRQLVLGRPVQSSLPVQNDCEATQFIASADPPPGLQLPPGLVDACRNQRLTVLIGSGMSLQRDVVVAYPEGPTWTTLPSWAEVPQRLAESLHRYTARNIRPRPTQSLHEFLSDLDYFRQALGENLYYPRTIFDIFTPHVAHPGLANKLLLRLPLRWLLTTNYDFILQYAAPPGTPVYTWREARAAREYLVGGRGLPPILKIHGCASRPNTVVLTSQEYQGLRQDQEYLSLLQHVFEEHTIFFVGFGFSDPYDLDLILTQARHAGAAAGHKFALMHNERRAQVQAQFPEIQIIPYTDHSHVPAILATLIQKVQ